MPDPLKLIDTIPALAGATVRHELGGGVASVSWLLDAPEGLLVLRQDRPLAARIGLDRTAEAHFLAQVGGIGPEVVFVDPEPGVLVTRFIEGRVWTPAQLGEPGGIKTLASLFRRLHALPAHGKAFDLAGIAARYAVRARSATADVLARDAADLAAEFYDHSARALCHHDAHAGNLVSATPRLLDWEYAALGDPLMDLAVVIGYHGWTDKQAAELLSAWHGSPDPAGQERLLGLCRLYEHISTLWQMVVSG